MKKAIAVLFTVAIFIASSLPAPAMAKDYLFYCLHFANESGADANGIVPLTLPTNSILAIKTDGGKLADQILKDMKNPDYMCVMRADAKLGENAIAAVAPPTSYTKVTINGSKMTVQREGGTQTTIEPTSDFYRRMMFPVEPTAKNEWTGWPTK